MPLVVRGTQAGTAVQSEAAQVGYPPQVDCNC